MWRAINIHKLNVSIDAHQGFSNKIVIQKTWQKIPKFSKISWIYTRKTQISKIFPNFCPPIILQRTRSMYVSMYTMGVCIYVCIRWEFMCNAKNGWIRIRWIPRPCSRLRAKGDKGNGTRAGWGRGRVFRGRWLWMIDSLSWMKVIDDRIWMKRDILDAVSMQRRGRQRKEAGALLAKNHFLTALFPPIPGGE
jgi:hypothetical protein